MSKHTVFRSKLSQLCDYNAFIVLEYETKITPQNKIFNSFA